MKICLQGNWAKFSMVILFKGGLVYLRLSGDRLWSSHLEVGIVPNVFCMTANNNELCSLGVSGPATEGGPFA